jgi:hypothetical protein
MVAVAVNQISVVLENVELGEVSVDHPERHLK